MSAPDITVRLFFERDGKRYGCEVTVAASMEIDAAMRWVRNALLTARKMGEAEGSEA